MLFFAGTLVPALGFFDVYPMRFSFVADHFQYLASAGLLAPLAAGIVMATQRWSIRRHSTHSALRTPHSSLLTGPRRRLLRALGSAGGTHLPAVPGLQGPADPLERHAGQEPRLLDGVEDKNRGKLYQELYQLDLALADLDKAIELKDDFELAWNNRGSVLRARGQQEKA